MTRKIIKKINYFFNWGFQYAEEYAKKHEEYLKKGTESNS